MEVYSIKEGNDFGKLYEALSQSKKIKNKQYLNRKIRRNIKKA